MTMNRLRLVAAPSLLIAAALPVCAAGGHHDVDDAVVLDTGQCQVEAWAFEGRRPALAALHLGPACRVGAFELGLSIDRLRIAGAVDDNAGPQIKWAIELLPQRLAIGLASGAVWRLQGVERRALVTTYLPVTVWLADNTLQLHANLGQDREPGAGVLRRWGVAGDWSLNERWVVTAERRSQLALALTRVGLRFNVTPLSSIDFSAARGGSTRLLALGFTQEWGR